jgi:hypothetical protein
MKKLLPILGLALTITACNSVPDQKNDTAQSTQPTVLNDTTGMAAFNAWKAQNELATVTPVQQPQQAQAAAPEKTRTIVKYVPVAAKTTRTAPSSSTSAPSPKPAPTQGDAGTSVGSDNGTGSGVGTGTNETAKVEKKEGWSKAAKGAVIGGVAGAAGGAILNKQNRVVGAVIGGVVGAAGGYGIGRGMDKKDGRIDYSTMMQ